ncbi:hypothetical protein ACSBM8_14470 [Sphingomonas sp. ASY06-1R]|uniref:hypothetical protein n=1 Tax=Sphingomonas sp. ASY06-1R TaxID=3445771 RepID=UPI003FA1ED99
MNQKNLRISGPAASRARALIVVPVCLLLMIGVAATGFSDLALEEGNASIALSVWPTSAAAMAGAAQDLSNQRRFEEAQTLASKALRLSPMNSGALRVVVLAAQQRHNDPLAETSLVLAARLGWRDGLAQLWLLNRAMTQQDFTVASQSADALLRIHYAEPEALGAMSMLIETPGGRAALAERLSEQPPWERTVLRKLDGHTQQQTENSLALIIMLQRLGLALGEGELGPFIDSAIKSGQGARVKKRLSRLDPALTADVDGGLSDGEFSQLASDAETWRPFGWQVANVEGVRVETPSSNEFHLNPVLRVETDSTKPAAAVSQVLALQPGYYVLTFKYKFEAGQRQAFTWQIQCAAQPTKLLNEMAIPDSAKFVWQENAIAFRVPEQCAGQRITMMTRPSLTGVSAAAFDDVHLAKRSVP